MRSLHHHRNDIRELRWHGRLSDVVWLTPKDRGGELQSHMIWRGFSLSKPSGGHGDQSDDVVDTSGNDRPRAEDMTCLWAV